MTDAQKIAAGLTEAQRDWLLAAAPTLEKVAKVPCAEWWDQPPLYVEIEGEDYWLGAKEMRSPEGCSEFTEAWEWLNETGLEVRKILEREA